MLKQGVAPEQIVFISLDHPILKLSSMDAILECYHENIHPDKDVYYFLMKSNMLLIGPVG